MAAPIRLSNPSPRIPARIVRARTTSYPHHAGLQWLFIYRCLQVPARSWWIGPLRPQVRVLRSTGHRRRLAATASGSVEHCGPQVFVDDGTENFPPSLSSVHANQTYNLALLDLKEYPSCTFVFTVHRGIEPRVSVAPALHAQRVHDKTISRLDRNSSGGISLIR